MLTALVKRSRPLPAHARLLVLGGGYSGRCVAKLARQQGTPVLCTRRVAGQPDADLIFDSVNGYCLLGVFLPFSNTLLN